ncbi:hypothetical protein EV198_1734 [Roseivirga ehrenbergii]|uniref:hypothetical protein n=1 Tax=Roseivirga ehrenbergii (strain DSM 102268 / JCM 13514 / KCTC 12282 / NCIMB 14502 / KMM 6017) TaxID=279360 RepID=UPI000AE69F5B|nr:hypothetical protein [Roseivirga ehrenbergii]TCL10702.1 hypothetical protein EV198_1734 [Roseivirga ehrenbergii]
MQDYSRYSISTSNIVYPVLFILTLVFGLHHKYYFFEVIRSYVIVAVGVAFLILIYTSSKKQKSDK